MPQKNYCLPILLVGLLAGTAAAGSKESSLTPNAGASIDGTGIGKGEALKDPSSKKEKKKPEDFVKTCSTRDIGEDSLWKFPSEGTKNGIVFLPPKNLCDWENKKDSLSRMVSYAAMCGEPSCIDRKLSFRKGNGCGSRTTREPVQNRFKDGPLFMVLRLHDGRHIYWYIKSPFTRNGKGYSNIKHETAPSCMRVD